MRHRKDGRRLGRNSSHREAMMRNMVTSLLENGNIKTTETRAKEVRRVAEKLITIGKRALPASNPQLSDEALQQRRLHLFRQILQVVRKQSVAKEVMEKYAPQFAQRPGGYTRMVKLGPRRGDNAPMSILELVGDSSAVAAPSSDAQED